VAVNLGSIYSYLELRLDRFNANLQQAKTKINETASAVQRASRRIGDSMRAAERGSKILAGALGGLAAAAGVAAFKGIKLAADMEQTEMAFETLLGSAEEADAFIRDLWNFAAHTPFEFQGLTKASRQLLAFGFDAKNIIPTMTAIGDAVSALGGGEYEIERVTRAIGQMRAKGKVSAEEMMQLAELGLPVWEMLAEAIGVDVATAMDMASKGAIDAATGIDAVLSGMGERFAGSMQKQSETWNGLMSTMKDIGSATLRSLGLDIMETFDLKAKLKDAIAWLEHFQQLLEEGGIRGALKELIPPDLQAKIVIIGGAIMGALVPALAALATAAWAAVAPLLPFIAAGAAIAGLAYLIYTNWDKVTTWFRETWTRFVEWLSDLWESMKETALKVWDYITAPVAAVVGWLAETWQSFSDWWHGWWDRLVGWVRGKVDAVLAPIRNIIDWVEDALAWLDRLFGAQDRAAGNMPATPSAPSARTPAGNIPHFPHGGIVTRPLLGLITAPEPEAVIPLSRLPGLLGLDRTDTLRGPVSIVIQLDGRTIARATLPHMHREIILRTGLA